jgi:thiosulfate/3-mercaptopyruvate sulfurtransferase
MANLQIVGIVLMLLPASETKETSAYPRANLLIEAADLAKEKTAEKFVILDARGKNKFNKGHIPGAIWVDATTWARAFTKSQDAEEWSKTIGNLGIDADKSVIVYDDTSSKDAARIWWILRYWGVKDARLLNGGWPAWEEAKGKIVDDVPEINALSPKLKAHPDRLATKEQMLDFVKGKKLQILDARSTEEFCGEANTAKNNGAIPTAIHQDWVDVLDKKTQKFKSSDELNKMFKEKGIDLDRSSVTYCQSGGRAAVLAFTLELMGVKEVRNYYKSWAEWGNAEDTPIVKPSKK